LKQFSFSKKDRILKRREFLQLKSCGKKIHDTNFLAIYSGGRYRKNRIGITVTKKLGNAVKRNKMKRLIREHFRINRGQIAEFMDIHIIAKKKAGEISADMVFNSLDRLQRKMPRRANH
jgi:ribonuclease P protein component